MMWLRKKHRDPEIAPDEIFLDASNAPDFDRTRLEGRIEKPLPSSMHIFLSATLVFVFAMLGFRAADLQLVQGEELAERSAQNSLAVETLFAPRGVIEDMHGTLLVENVEHDDGTLGRKYLYPEMGQIIGYVSYPKKDSSGNYYDTDMTGVAGLEAMYNDLLSGTNGQVLTETDALGRVRSEGTIVKAEPGGTLRLSIDATLERHFSNAVSSIVESAGFIAGAGVIMDVHTGAIRAIVSYPSYDPNIMSNGGPADTIARYNHDAGRPFLDHSVQGAYAPGSIVKPFIVAGALTDGIITPLTIVNDTGVLSVPDPYNPGKKYLYRGWRALGPVDARKAIAWSSDAYFYTVGGGFGEQKGLGIDRLTHWYRAFGLGESTGVDLPGEVNGLLPTPEWKKATLKEPWYLGDTYFTSIGQYSMQVTPIQIVRATAALANGGKLMTPTMVEGATPSFTNVPVDPETLRVAREGMRMSVTQALASAINVPYVTAAAKTGTAEVGTRNQYDNSWVEGFFPYENPQYAFAVVLERGPAGTGEKAVHVVRNLFESLHADGSLYALLSASSTTAFAN